MPPYPATAPFLPLFRKTADFIDSVELAEPYIRKLGEKEPSLRELLAIYSLRWEAKLLRAVALLLESGCTLEVGPLVRSLLEAAINVTWFRSDDLRAQRFRDSGLVWLRKWRDDMLYEIPNYFPQSALDEFERQLKASTGHTSIPSLEKRADEAFPPGSKIPMSKAYAFAYRRLSMAAHSEYRLFPFLGDDRESFQLLEAQDAAAAGAILLASGCECLGALDLAAPLYNELLATAKESQKRAGSTSGPAPNSVGG